MSSTNRSAKRKLQDFYITPVPAIVTFLKALQEDFPYDYRHLKFLDPCAGGDANHEMSYPTAIEQVWPGASVTTIDIREDSKAEFLGDYLTSELDTRPDIVMSNPPFFLAQDFILKALKDVKEVGLVIMLLRLNYFGSHKRQSFWLQNMPTTAYVHAERMSFTEDGKTDSIEYCHCLWKQGVHPKFTQMRIV